MSSIFLKIIVGEIFVYKIVENDWFLVFLDIMFLQYGYMFVILKMEVDYLFDIEDELFGEMMVFVKECVYKICQVFLCKKVGVVVVGLEVLYVYIYLVLINLVVDMNFLWEKMQFLQEEFVFDVEKIWNS